MDPERRRTILRRVCAFAAFALACESVAAVLALAVSWRFAAVGTLSCAALAVAALYSAFEGYDDILRRPR